MITEAKKKAAEIEIRRLQNEVKYDVRDMVIGYVVDRFSASRFYIPAYQRDYIWSLHHKCRFVESVILGLPIPMMFFADMPDGRLEIVDGAQRTQTLVAFLSNAFRLEGLERLATLNGFSFSDLPDSQQRKLDTRALRVVVLEESTTSELRQEIFNRINTSGEQVRPSEVRRGAYAGPFMDFVHDCAEQEQFRRICPITESARKRREQQELVLRFFAFSDRYLDFVHDVAPFLNKYVVAHQKSFDAVAMQAEFQRMLDFVETYFPNGFAKTAGAKTTPRVRFEAISVGVNLALRIRPDLKPANMKWLNSQEFKKHTTSGAANSRPKLRGRIEYVRDCLLEGSV